MPRVPVKTRAKSRRPWQKRESFYVKPLSRGADARSSRMFHQELCILSVQRHSINRRVVFVFLLQNTEEFLASQPKRIPNEIILARNTNCLFAGEIEFLDRRLRTVPVFTLMLGAAIDIHQQCLAVRRNSKSITTIHARISQNLRELPFLQNVSVQIDLVNIVEIVTENRFSIARPRRLAKRFAL